MKGNNYEKQMLDVHNHCSEFRTEIAEARIWASVEEHSRWRVRGFYCLPENERDVKASNYMYVGDVIALNLSEMNLYLNVVKPHDT